MRIRKKTEPDLYVINRPLTQSENEEISLFITNYKKKHKLIFPKVKPAVALPKAKKYEVVKTNVVFAREPESDSYKDIKKRKLTPKRNPARKNPVKKPLSFKT